VTFVHHERVRFNDCDPMGHVNNATYSTYLEQARLAWFDQDDEHPLRDVILARTEIDFRSPAAAGEEIEITVRPVRVGTKSFELAYALHAAGRLVAEARSVLVGYDYEQAKSTEIPERWRRRMESQ
jgi:acyl-CoA thioester hydrolase